MRTTFELWQAALQDPILAPVMQGVFPRDKLPIVNKYPSGLIANTDPHDQPGTHWVAMYFISPWESEFFDSYGFPPDTYGMDGYIERDVTRYNNKPFQGLTSDTCGDYCLFYLFHRARNVDMDAIQAKFRSHDTQWNDAQVATFVHSYVKSLTSVRQRSPFFQSEQTCKSFKCWRKESIKCCLK